MTGDAGAVDPARLRGLELFAGCDEGERRRAARLLRSRRYEPGEVILERGEGDRRLVIVLEGRVRVVTPRGVEGTLGPGDIVGEMALRAGAPRNATVTAEWATWALVADGVARDRLLGLGDVDERVRAVSDARHARGADGIIGASTVRRFARPPRVMGRGAGLVARSRRGHRPVRLLALGLLGLLAIGLGAFVLVGNTSTPVRLGDVLADYTGGPGGAAGATTTDGAPEPTRDGAPATTPASPASAEPGRAPPSPAGAAGGAGPGPTEASEPAGAPSPEPAATAPPAEPPPSEAPPPYRRPEPGVYTYATTGGESISVPNGEHRYPEETYGVVRHGDGCRWSMERRVLEEHTERHGRCGEPGAFWALRDMREVSFFGETQRRDYRCDPPGPVLWEDATPGDRAEATCVADNGDSMSYEVRFVEDVVMVIDGVDVPTERARFDVELRGSARGRSEVEVWLDAATGLVVREERETRAEVDSDFGTVDYREDATFELATVEPQR